MNIAQSIMALYPNLDPVVDFMVQDDGGGQYIAQWNSPDSKPTQEDLERGWKLHLDNQVKEDVLKAKSEYFKEVKKVYLSNPDDISRSERIEFAEYFTFADNGLFYPLEEYPAIVLQIQEWITQEKLPPLPN